MTGVEAPGRTFASDNNAGVHPLMMAAIAGANPGHARAYGDDQWTARARQAFVREFGEGTEAFFVFNGTGANVVGLQALCRSWESVVCTDLAHIHVDECGAPEKATGAKLHPLAAGPEAKLTVAMIEPLLGAHGVVHHSQPRVISITQATEKGCVYTVEEIRALADFAHGNRMLLHMDGARLANAVAHLGRPVRELTRDAGVDLLSFGGTKNGMLFGEAVVTWDADVAARIPFLRKQSMQLASKMRFVSAQFASYLEGGLWLRLARQANAMAKLLGEEAVRVGGVKLTAPVQANEVFARLPAHRVAELQRRCWFYVWDPRPAPGEVGHPTAPGPSEPTAEVRWVASWDTAEADVHGLVAALREVLTPTP